MSRLCAEPRCEVERNPNDRATLYSFALRFCLYTVLGFSVLYLAPVDIILAPALRALAAVTGKVLVELGYEAIVIGRIVVLPGVFGIEIAAECSGASLLILIIGAIAAYPASNGYRLVGILMAIVAVCAGNLIRLVTLLLIGIQASEYFEPAHSILWNGLVYLGLVGVWVIWLHPITRPARAIRAKEQT